MRLRRLSAFFWCICIAAFIIILYVITDLSFKLPGIMPPMQLLDDNKWSSFEVKLQEIEQQLNEHNAAVGEIKNAVNQIVQKATEKQSIINKNIVEKSSKFAFKKHVFKHKETKKVIPKPVWKVPSMNMSQCALRKETLPKTDVQMLSMYDRLDFKDIDGGVWKQGWQIEYQENQWSSANPLKVFIVPHSHNDPGWLKTFENYYKTQTKAIFNNMVSKLEEVPGRKFIWAETSFLALWWTTDATVVDKQTFKKLLNAGNIEIVTGGWVMNDEANSHFLSIIQQLTTGHQWLLENLNYVPKNHWSIDPFGYSSTQPYLLKLAGFKNSVIQRVHYRIKKELAMNRQLEFKWRQLWDGVGSTDMFTHVMPFYSYDVPHTCGPDPKICCQFDFKRLPGRGVSCPWGIPPKKIIQKNVAERAFLILDQWRKKVQLYRSNVVLVPLGDDFRYDSAAEWNDQMQNYEQLIDYINNNDRWNARVQFGTLEDYFQALHEETKLTDFPVLSGDFFTYADRNQHYWSGYYTSRPFYKAMDRVLLSYVRAAESIISLVCVERLGSNVLRLQLRDRAEAARRALALFQHHDGVTGTARDHVTKDYSLKMVTAIQDCQSAIQQSAWLLSGQPDVGAQSQPDVYMSVDDIWRRPDELPSRLTLPLDALAPTARVRFYNALNFQRTEIVTVLVPTPHVEVFDPEGRPMMSQVSPLVSGEQLRLIPNKYQLSFPATVPALGIAAYTVSLRDNMTLNKYTSYARVRLYNADYWSVELAKAFAVEQAAGRLQDDVSFTAGNSTRVVINKNGYLKAISQSDGSMFPLAMDFAEYGTRHETDNSSGAYLFLPSGPAAPFKPGPFPEIAVIEGPFLAASHAVLRAPRHADILLTLTTYNNGPLSAASVEVRTEFLLDAAADDLELSMRLSSRIRSDNVLYTDLNGMQMIKRKYFEKLPLQANFYPLPSAAYVQDGTARLSALPSAPLGVASTAPGQIEIMLDRRLSRDDNRGLQQGVQDNVRTAHAFRLLAERARLCTRKTHEDHPSGQLTLAAHVLQQTLLQPLTRLVAAGGGGGYARGVRGAADVTLASLRSHVTAASAEGYTMSGLGLVFHRVDLEQCYGDPALAEHYPDSGGLIDLQQYMDIPADALYESTLTFTQTLRKLDNPRVTLCPQETRAFFLNLTSYPKEARGHG